MSNENKAELETCPLCKDLVPVTIFFEENAARTRLTQFRCMRCGEFNADQHFIATSRSSGPNPDLMGLAREKYERGDRLTLTDTNLDKTKKQAQELAQTTTAEKVRRLLRAIAKKSQLLRGQTIKLVPEFDYPLVFGRNAEEFMLFLEDFERRGWLDMRADSASNSCKLTVKGWIEFESDKA